MADGWSSWSGQYFGREWSANDILTELGCATRFDVDFYPLAAVIEEGESEMGIVFYLASMGPADE